MNTLTSYDEKPPAQLTPIETLSSDSPQPLRTSSLHNERQPQTINLPTPMTPPLTPSAASPPLSAPAAPSRNVSFQGAPIPPSPPLSAKKQALSSPSKHTGRSIGTPFNFEKKLHVDGDFNWFGEGNPREMFDIQEKLGEGAFGAVFKAVLKQTGFVMAIKEVLVGKLNDRETIQKEINMLRQCRHRNTVQYYGCCNVDDDSIWILNDYCGAGSIADCIELTESTFTEQQTAVVMAAAVEGLAFLHSRNIVHRDVKCANILLTENGLVKIGDFGVSEKLTQTICVRNSIVGTPYWMSPEVITGSDYGTEADIWSLGVTAIEMTDGVPPHSDVHPMRAMFKIPFLPPPTLMQPSAYSKVFNHFISRCLIKDPKKRPSAQDLLKHPFIERFVGQQDNLDLRKPLMEKVREVMARRVLIKKSGKPKGGRTVVPKGEITGRIQLDWTPKAKGTGRVVNGTGRLQPGDLLQTSAIKPRGMSDSSITSHGTVVIHSEEEGESVQHSMDSSYMDTMVIREGAPTYGSPAELEAQTDYLGTMVIHQDAEHFDVKLGGGMEMDIDASGTMVIHPGEAEVDIQLGEPGNGTIVIHQDEQHVDVRLRDNDTDADVESDDDAKDDEEIDAEFLITGGASRRKPTIREESGSVRYAPRLSDITDDEHILFTGRKSKSTVATKLKKRLDKFRKTLKGNIPNVEESDNEREYLEMQQSRRSSDRRSSDPDRTTTKSLSLGENDSPRILERPTTMRSVSGPDGTRKFLNQDTSYSPIKRRANSGGNDGPGSVTSRGKRSGSWSSIERPRSSSESNLSVTSVKSGEVAQHPALSKFYERVFGMRSEYQYAVDGPTVKSPDGDETSTRPRSFSSVSLGKVDGEVDVNELVRIHDELVKEIEAAKRARSGSWWSQSSDGNHEVGEDNRPISVAEQEEVAAGEVAGWAMRIPWMGSTAAFVVGRTVVLGWKIGRVIWKEYRSNFWL